MSDHESLEPRSSATRLTRSWSRRSRWILLLAVLALVAEAAFVGRSVLRDDSGTLSVQGRRGGQPRAQSAFDLSRLAIPRDEVLAGGPPKDGIPALTNPPMAAREQAKHVGPNDRVIGVVIGDDARAYPLKIVTWHEVVNDRVGDVPVAVTYCPLCDSAAVFDRGSESGGEREFGVSGLLYNSNVLMYERGGKTESLFSQMMARGVSGPRVDEKLPTLPVELTTWQDWIDRHPKSKVLAPDRNSARDYGRDPYVAYFKSPELMFPVKNVDRRMPLKEPVLGVWSGESARAYPIAALAKVGMPLEQEIGGRKLKLDYNPKTRTARVVQAEEGVQWVYSLWFAWYAFHPKTEVFDTGGLPPRPATRPTGKSGKPETQQF